ncbi:hypothetical protein BUALT_Bualt13G0000500 [Buddleja alternifolia]|uniref:DELLA protein RGL1-like n=1 Tax=Buddleja alternifolia TaxID=168488 RepID=A0AAV6WQ73_9LAMI|nr:hypothetical protein BUALT_Bualt13G0000500 [Buddleja alternifolia]
MANAVSSSCELDDNIPGDYDPVAGFSKDEALSRSKEGPWFEMDESGFMDLLYSVFDQEKKTDLFGNEDQQPVSDIDGMQIEANHEAREHEDIHLHPPIVEFKGKTNSFSVASSWDLLNNYGKGFRMPKEENPNDEMIETNVSEPKLSMEEMLRVGGERFIQFSTNRVDGISMFIHPYSASSLSGLSADDARDVELVHLLLSAAETVGTQQYDVATKLISRCLWTASDSGTPVQRVAFYFAEALQDKINRESGKISNNNNNDEKKKKKKQPEKGLALGTNNTFLATHQQLPFIQVMQFAGIQAIIENVKTARKIHLIDLQIRSGIQWTALMQGLAESQIELLKITAVGTSDHQSRYIEETGKRLLNFAESLNLPFSFKVVYLKDMSEFKEDILNIEADETVAVYSFLMLRSMISKPELLENVMRTIARVKPAVMVVTEVEANNNSPSFVDRFIETLLFYSAFFDCLEECMERKNEYRRILESSYSSEGIRNIVAAEGEERVTRNVKVDVWRAYFRRFGMREMELSESSKYQASLVVKQFSKGGTSSCTLEYNGKGLVVGWKGTPFHSLTAWNFS